MKKFIVALFLVVLILTSAYTINITQATTTPTITVDSNTQNINANIGNSIQANITINNVQDLWSWDLENITFNPSMLNLTSVTEGPFLQQAGKTIFVSAPVPSYQTIYQGYISEVADAQYELPNGTYAEAGVSGSGVLLTLTFTVLQIGTSQITFGQTNIYNTIDTQAMPSTAVNATITVATTTTETIPVSNNSAIVDESATTGVSVTITGSLSTLPNGAQVTVTSTNYESTQPSGTNPVSLNDAVFYDVTVTSSSGALSSNVNAKVSITNQAFNSLSQIEYWNGINWVLVATMFTSPDTVTGNIPAAALNGTSLVVGRTNQLSTPTPTPSPTTTASPTDTPDTTKGNSSNLIEFIILPIAAAIIIVIAIAIMLNKKKKNPKN